MGSLHWLLLIAFYFFIALNLLLLLMVLSRAVRVRTSINPLVLAAVFVSIAIVCAPLVSGWARLGDYTGTKLLLLLLASFVLAALDVSLAPRLPLPLDRELEDL